ncbi:trafficking protein particle complex subunit 10-like [Macrosteles quadrilineatus]|uniref:trafficking protein particle complex subunit 10-like n=1 Tax=Macrosteles quadrilineatus TaxID=74068 RepID=UPI0023E0BB8B|nr:trafficking protein particle complex subunit 10-like [Macrosteles quadrilineatus]
MTQRTSLVLNGLTEETGVVSIMDKKPIVTFSGDKDLFKNLEPLLTSALPQEPTEWRRSYGRIIKSVHVPATFVPFSKDILPKEGDYRLIHQPIFHTYWTQCPDVETYKSTGKEGIESWMKILNQNNISDWMIVLVETYDFRRSNKLIPRTTVLDKIRSDFGSKHADRCLSVINPLKSESRSAGSWRGLLVNFRLLLLFAYDRALLRFEEIVREQREKRNQPGWSFCQYFLLQEELAFVLEMLGVYEEALVQYDELDALFTQFVLNSNLGDTPKWLSGFQAAIDQWPGLSLSKTIDVEARKKIQQSDISLLQFRSYLFSRQCSILMATCKPWEIAQRCLPFLHNCINELRILEVDSPEGAVASWIFLCCLEVLDTCARFNDTSQVAAYSLFTATLWAYARDKLTELGQLCGLMPGVEITGEHLHTVVLLSAGIGDTPTNTAAARLRQALSSKEAFKKQYLELSELAISTYKLIGRARCAHDIGKNLSSFYKKLGDLNSASMFLRNSLHCYVEDGWHQLAAQTRIELASCYRELKDCKRYCKTCASIASTTHLDIETRMFYFDEMKRLLEDHKSEPQWTCRFSESFALSSIRVQVLEMEDVVEATVVLRSNLPGDIACPYIQIATEPSKKEPNITKKAAKEDTGESKPDKLVSWVDFEELKSTSQKAPLVEKFDYKQDKSLAQANVATRFQKSACLRRQDSQLRPTKIVTIARADYTHSLKTTYVTLKPGKNEIVLRAKTEQPGMFKLCQLCVGLPGLEFLSDCIKPRLKYEVVDMPITTRLIKGEKDLLAGLPQTLVVNIHTGSRHIPHSSVLRLHTTAGLTLQLTETDTPSRQLDIALPAAPPFKTLELPIIVFAELAPQRDSSPIDHVITLRCPWVEDEKPLLLQFQPPFLTVSRLHTAYLHKFIHVSVVGLSDRLLQLSQPQLVATSTCPVQLVSHNPTEGQRLFVSSDKRVAFMWELQPDDSPSTPPIRTEFTVQYKPLTPDNSPHITYKCPFDIINYKTLFIVEARVEPTKDSEFCRASTVCHLHISVQRVCASSDTSLMYEVLADQTMWAICANTAGVINVEAGERQSVTLDVMPLINGYLPLPLVRLSKYIPADVKLSSGRVLHADSHPRSEPFSPGQVYNCSKGSQVHVIAAATT